jgi:hypothetical protein
MSMIAMRLLRRWALLAPLALVLAGPANAGAEVRGSAVGGCLQAYGIPGGGASWCLGTASGRGQGDDPYSFRFVTGTGMGYHAYDDGPPCGFDAHGADPKLTYLAVRPDHTAYAVIHFLGTWSTGQNYDVGTGQCLPVETTFDNRPWDLGVTWANLPETEFDTVCFSVWDCGPGGYFPPDILVRKREVRRWWG